MRFFSYRILNLAGFLLIVFILGCAIYLQQHLHLQPCPLCIMQRILFGILGILFFIGSLYQPKRFFRTLYAILLLVVSILGVLLASRQVYLQHLPPGEQPACAPNFYYLLQHFPFSQSLPIFFRGSGDCATVQWTLWHLSIAEWSLGFFIIFAGVGLMQMWRK
jgi:protein dithiol:quinone oxidoreductase